VIVFYFSSIVWVVVSASCISQYIGCYFVTTERDSTVFLKGVPDLTALKIPGEWRYSFTMLGLGARWRRVVSFKPQPLYPRGNSPSTHWLGIKITFNYRKKSYKKRSIGLQGRMKNVRIPKQDLQ
jgi:hypothetical protein